MWHMSGKTRNENGFTLVEVAVVVPMIIIIVVGILSMLILLVTSNVIQGTRSEVVSKTRAALATVEKDVNNSNSFFPSTLPSATFKDFNEPGLSGTYKTWGTGDPGSSSGHYVTNSCTALYCLNTLFIKGYNQIIDPVDNTKVIPAFIGPPPCSAATAKLDNVSPVAILYFVDAGTLYRRTIVDRTNPTLCGTGPLMRQSCPSGSDSNTPACAVKDTVILDNVSQFKVDYLLNPSDTTPMNAYASVPSPTIDQAKAIIVTVIVNETAASGGIRYTNSLRMSRTGN